MSDNLVYALNETSGVVGSVPEHYLTHPVLGANLRPVRTGKPIATFLEPAFPRTGDEAKVETEDEAKTIDEPTGTDEKED